MFLSRLAWKSYKDYFTHVSNNTKNDLACEIIIELGNKKYWDTKDLKYKKKMTNVFKQQVIDLENLVPNFKIASAIIHYDETSPHMHIVGVPVKDGYKNGMRKQVAKSQIFTKTSLSKLQDKMRINCIKSFNKYYEVDYKLKEKELGRNFDIPVNKMTNYRQMKKDYEKNKQKLKQANEKTDIVNTESNKLENIITTLKPNLVNKKNYTISSEQLETKNLWNKFMKFFKNRVRYYADESYKKVFEAMKKDNILRQDDIDYIDNKNAKNKKYERW